MGSNRAQRTGLCELTVLRMHVCMCELVSKIGKLVCFRRKVTMHGERDGGRERQHLVVYLDAVV